jgi:DNA polymerase-3 subunit epsilon
MDTMALHGFLRKREEKACAFHEGDNGPRDLVSLAGKSGIPIADAHTALGDAFLTAQLFQRYLAALHRHGYETIGDLLRAGAP